MRRGDVSRPGPLLIETHAGTPLRGHPSTQAHFAAMPGSGGKVSSRPSGAAQKLERIPATLRWVSSRTLRRRRSRYARPLAILAGTPGGRLPQPIHDHRKGTPMPILLAALLACLMLTTVTAQDEAPLPIDDERIAALFQFGMEVLAEAEQAEDEAARGELYDKAIAAFHMILVDRPDLVRARLELARLFFLKGRDGLARRHFEAVLAGGVPLPVAANIQTFLNIMQARKRLTGYFGMAIAPDSNLNAASESEIIYIDTVFGRLPFTREGDFGAESGFGVSVWGGGEYQQPVSERFRLRVGSDVAVRDYPGGDFDQHFVAAHVGPRWLAGPRTELSLLGTVSRQWLGSHPYADELGARLELDRRLTPGIWARGTAAYRERTHRHRAFLDGPVADFTATFAWTPAPVLRVHLTVGYESSHAALEHWRNLSRWVRVGTSLALPFGFTLGTSIQARRTYYDGDGGAHLTLNGRPRRDRTRTFSVSVLNRALTVLGFSPQLALIHDTRLTNAQAQDYDRNRAELRFVRQF